MQTLLHFLRMTHRQAMLTSINEQQSKSALQRNDSSTILLLMPAVCPADTQSVEGGN